jgi:DHA2 family multidrug resistance protein
LSSCTNFEPGGRWIVQTAKLCPICGSTVYWQAEVFPQDAAAASGISNMFRNLGGAIGTAVHATVITKREQFHSNIIGQSVTLGPRGSPQPDRATTDYFVVHVVPDPAEAHQEAVIALGKTVKHQALAMEFSDTFAVIAGVLVLAAVAVLLTRG